MNLCAMNEFTKRSTNLLRYSSTLTINCMNESWRKNMMKNLEKELKLIQVVYHHRILKDQISIKDDASTSMLILYQWNWTSSYAITKERISKLNEAIWKKIRRVIRVTNRVTSLKIVVREKWCLNDKSMLCWKKNSMNKGRKISIQIIRISRKSSQMTIIFEFEISKNYNKF